MKKNNNEKHYAWIMGADMYLATAVILCNEMLKSYSYSNNCLNNIQRIDKKCGFTSANPDYEMLMPVIFNLKHGIELYLKALIMRANEKAEYPSSHDLSKLFNKYKDEFIIQIKDEVTEKFNTAIEPIIEKYYYGLYAFEENKTNPDINNEAERYPECKNNSCYEVSNLFEIVNRNLITSIKADCQTLQTNLRELLKEVYKKIEKLDSKNSPLLSPRPIAQKID